MSQGWEHVLYLHYRVAADELRALVPEPMELDIRHGDAWVSLLPLHMTGVRLRDLFPIPGTSNFPELNVRTYVVHDGIPGVYFLSIDASSRLASLLANLAFDLPYHDADMSFSASDGGYRLNCERRADPSVHFDVSYRPIGKAHVAEPSTLTSFLAERYCMYEIGPTRRLRRADISHEPWATQQVEVTIERNDVLAALGLNPLDPDPVMAYSPGTSARCWPMRSARVPQRIWPRH